MLITAETIITGDGKTLLREHGLVLDEGKILAVERLERLRADYPEQELTDFGAATILPGLMDMHIHLAYYDGRSDQGLYDDRLVAYLAQDLARRQLHAGVTTLRDAYCPDGVCRQLALAAAKGWLEAPRLIHCNQALCISGGIDWKIDGTTQVDGVEEIRKAVRCQFRAGAQWIKAMTDWRTPGVAEFSLEELQAIVEESHRLGHKAMAHATMQPALALCIAAGFDSIEHGIHLTLEQGRIMAQRGIAWTPTVYVHQAVYEQLDRLAQEQGLAALSPRQQQTYRIYGEALQAYRDNFLPIYETGVLVTAGTDCPFEGMEQVTVAQELECLVKLGLTPVQAIQTATANPARLLDMEGQIGLLAPGAIADITVAEGDASADVTALKRVRAVFQAGRRI